MRCRGRLSNGVQAIHFRAGKLVVDLPQLALNIWIVRHRNEVAFLKSLLMEYLLANTPRQALHQPELIQQGESAYVGVDAFDGRGIMTAAPHYQLIARDGILMLNDQYCSCQQRGMVAAPFQGASFVARRL